MIVVLDLIRDRLMDALDLSCALESDAIKVHIRSVIGRVNDEMRKEAEKNGGSLTPSSLR